MAHDEFWWHPDPARAASSRLGRLLHRCGLEATPEGYAQLHARSIAEPESFWRLALDELGLAWLRPFDAVLDESRGPAWADFFPGGQINACQNAIDRWLDTRRDAAAVLWFGDGGEQRRWTLGELAREVDHGVRALAGCGVGKGDRVAIFLPMLPETAAALLAILRIGAIAVPCFSGYGAEAVASRLSDSQAKVLITTDAFPRRGRLVKAKETADQAVELAGCVERVLVVERTGGAADSPWNASRDVPWPRAFDALEGVGTSSRSPSGRGSQPPRPTSPLGSSDGPTDGATPCHPTAANDPALLMYTSGTTGRPKGVIATHGGFPLKIAVDMAWCFDVEVGDRLLWVTDLGWVMGPWQILGTLTLGATMVLLEGTPDYPAADRLWEIVERARVTHLGVAPTVVRALREKGEAPVRAHDLSSLRVLGSTGEAWNPEPYRWFAGTVGGGRLPIVNYSGGTEIGGGILGCTMLHPLRECGFSAAILGIDADVVDENGQALTESVGELIVRRPWPGMTHGFWQDPERYEQTYWSRWPGLWVHGDFARRLEAGGWVIEGRSDDTIKLAGKRLGPAEVESLLTADTAVLEAAAIEVPHPVKGGALVCYVVLALGTEPTEALRSVLISRVERGLGRAMKPEAILFVCALPKTRNAKIMRRLIRSVHLERTTQAPPPQGDISSLEDPSTLNAIRNAI